MSHVALATLSSLTQVSLAVWEQQLHCKKRVIYAVGALEECIQLPCSQGKIDTVTSSKRILLFPVCLEMLLSATITTAGHAKSHSAWLITSQT